MIIIIIIELEWKKRKKKKRIIGEDENKTRERKKKKKETVAILASPSFAIWNTTELRVYRMFFPINPGLPFGEPSSLYREGWDGDEAWELGGSKRAGSGPLIEEFVPEFRWIQFDRGFSHAFGKTITYNSVYMIHITR